MNAECFETHDVLLNVAVEVKRLYQATGGTKPAEDTET